MHAFPSAKIGTSCMQEKVEKLATLLADEKELKVTQDDLEDMKKKAMIMTKELEDRKRELRTSDRASSDRKASTAIQW